MALGVPVVLLFFSYLYAVSVLIGTYNRSRLLASTLDGLAAIRVASAGSRSDSASRRSADRWIASVRPRMRPDPCSSDWCSLATASSNLIWHC